MDWGTVERLDGPLHLPNTDHSATSEQPLEVPELTDDVLQGMEADARQAEESLPSATDNVQRGEPGSTVECEVCGRNVRVKRDGTLGVHKCEPKPARGNRFEHLPERRHAPKKPRDFVIGVTSWAVEEGAASLLARPFNADPDEVPTELPDPDAMLGPIVDTVWPTLPKGAQAFLEACADNSDLIACALMWGDWMRELNRWTREQRRFQRNIVQTREGTPHAAQSSGADEYNGLNLVPFTPA